MESISWDDFEGEEIKRSVYKSSNEIVFSAFKSKQIPAIVLAGK